MKILLSFCVVICAANFCSAANEDDVNACTKETNVDRKTLDDIKITEDYTPPEDVKNFVVCIYKKDGILKEDGSVNLEFGNGKLTEWCKVTDAGKDLTENIVKLMKCFSEQDSVSHTPFRRVILDQFTR